jgi:hypothetical protein
MDKLPNRSKFAMRAGHLDDEDATDLVPGLGALDVIQKVLPSHTRDGSRMRESRTYGSGAARLAAIPAGESPANRGVQSLL